MAETAPIVRVVDDDQNMLDYLSALLDSVGLATETYLSAAAYLEDPKADQPGCVVVDVRMPGMSGLDLQKALKAEEILLPVIIMTGHADVDMAISAMKDGAFDFIQKPINDQKMLECIQRAVESSLADRNSQAERAVLGRNMSRLTPREKEVLEQVVAGEPNKRIAYNLKLSEKTIEFHRSNLMVKMQAKSVAELVKLTLKVGKTQGNP